MAFYNIYTLVSHILPATNIKRTIIIFLFEDCFYSQESFICEEVKGVVKGNTGGTKSIYASFDQCFAMLRQ